jgi:heme-degrading monooxygenase HmoA
MIARTWRGATAASDADRYLAYLQQTGLAEYAATPGNRGVLALRRIAGGQAEFLLISFWDGMEAVRRFAGPGVDRAVFYPEDDRFLVARDLDVHHYEVVHRVAP